jgi:hypothetical protein
MTQRNRVYPTQPPWCTLPVAFGDSLVTQRITLRAGAERLDFETEVDWHEREKFLEVAFPGGRASTRLTADFTVDTATATDLLERRLPSAGTLPVTDGSTVQLWFRPFEIRTLRLTRAEGTIPADSSVLILRGAVVFRTHP